MRLFSARSNTIYGSTAPRRGNWIKKPKSCNGLKPPTIQRQSLSPPYQMPLQHGCRGYCSRFPGRCLSVTYCWIICCWTPCDSVFHNRLFYCAIVVRCVLVSLFFYLFFTSVTIH